MTFMANQMLDQIRNWKSCNVSIPAGYEIAAIVDYTVSLWGDFTCIEDTARLGVAEEDKEGIYNLIEEYELEIDPEEAITALYEYCVQAVTEAKTKAK